ncbi:hypothetical protein TSUD_12290 [Trifolium subterraneum]|uniref:Uncharacterized protein n=1 Tax=Trifolium subterraneum TaxID=3900 RepID=A0A2Z6MCT7_TRISU|nr:hypothetical protein TSUD_12290 [Trifolium subterraneum]
MEREMLIFMKWLKTKDANDMDYRMMSRFVFRMFMQSVQSVGGRCMRQCLVLGEALLALWEPLVYKETTAVRESILSNEVNLLIL